MSKALYHFDVDTKFLTKVTMVSNSYEPQAGETFLPVPDGLFEPIRHLVDDKGQESWVGTSKEDWEKANPGTPSKPTATQEMLNALGSQVAKVTQENTQMKSMINTLGQQVAQLTSEKGGN